MNKQTLTKLISENLFRIPDYQRGYAWEKSHWDDFIQDLDALVNGEARSHYTGTVVVYKDGNREPQAYGKTKKLPVLDVVDGQQRLTTSTLYLSIVVRELVARGADDFCLEVPTYLYAGSTARLILNNDCHDAFRSLLQNGRINTMPRSIHEQRLVDAHDYLSKHIKKQIGLLGGDGVDYLQNLFEAITQKLSFTYYAIEEECEIGMTFELMNSRGKDLSVLELLKNYLMHWISRNVERNQERTDLTFMINRDWKNVYANLGVCDGNEDQCLRVAWVLYCSYTPANWSGYAGFKALEYIPIRDFSVRNKEEVLDFLVRFSAGLAEISRHYARIICPEDSAEVAKGEAVWLRKLLNVGNIANFLPIMVAARKQVAGGSIAETDYIEILQALECYAYRVFLFSGRRSNAGKSRLYRLGYDLFSGSLSAAKVVNDLHQLLIYYSRDEDFLGWMSKPEDWYACRRLLRYTLFEYELYLLDKEGKGKTPLLEWNDLSDSTFEHILPQNPAADSHWLKVWSQEEIKRCLGDIGNLVLTQNNSNYLNFDFERKKGSPGVSPSYANSDIRQERRVAIYQDWSPEEFAQRRDDIVIWMKERWKSKADPSVAEENYSDTDDDI